MLYFICVYSLPMASHRKAACSSSPSRDILCILCIYYAKPAVLRFPSPMPHSVYQSASSEGAPSPWSLNCSPMSTNAAQCRSTALFMNACQFRAV